VKRLLRLIACRRCRSPVVTTEIPFLIRCDITTLDPGTEARAWLHGVATYEVRTIGREQHLMRRFCTRETAQVNIAHAIAGTRPDVTVLSAHACPGPGPADSHLHDWQPHDRQPFAPPPRPPEPEEPPF